MQPDTYFQKKKRKKKKAFKKIDQKPGQKVSEWFLQLVVRCSQKINKQIAWQTAKDDKIGKAARQARVPD